MGRFALFNFLYLDTLRKQIRECEERIREWFGDQVVPGLWFIGPFTSVVKMRLGRFLGVVVAVYLAGIHVLIGFTVYNRHYALTYVLGVASAYALLFAYGSSVYSRTRQGG